MSYPEHFAKEKQSEYSLMPWRDLHKRISCGGSIHYLGSCIRGPPPSYQFVQILAPSTDWSLALKSNGDLYYEYSYSTNPPIGLPYYTGFHRYKPFQRWDGLKFKILLVSASRKHVLFYTTDHELYSFGDNRRGMVDPSRIQRFIQLPGVLPILEFRDKPIKQIFCTTHHSYVLLNNGSLFIMGIPPNLTTTKPSIQLLYTEVASFEVSESFSTFLFIIHTNGKVLMRNLKLMPELIELPLANTVKHIKMVAFSEKFHCIVVHTLDDNLLLCNASHVGPTGEKLFLNFANYSEFTQFHGTVRQFVCCNKRFFVATWDNCLFEFNELTEHGADFKHIHELAGRTRDIYADGRESFYFICSN
ncbi:MAG: hypothetical protein ACMG6E_02185 [Candidatus Roizmanbacteria bacterium]